MRPQVANLQELLEPAVTALGYELLGIEHLPQGRHSLLRLYIDTEEGIQVADCERVSHQVSGILEVEDPISGNYTLEVSSPGLDRPFFTLQQAQRYIGHQVKLRLRLAPGLDRQRKFTGKLMAADDDRLVIQLDEETLDIPWNSVEKANLVSDI
ncbi:MAG: ribosome maturation factor RimP [Gammaproteobacteria bacterium]|nr:MAG: ribosome maturation factor RimP [Gammaproteobacteria bacterium]